MDLQVWLQVETKARNMVKELLEPTIRRVADTSKQIENLAHFQTTLTYKVEDLENTLTNVDKRLVIIDEFTKKLNEMEAFQQILDSKNTREREETKSMVYNFGKKQVIFEEQLEVLQRQRDALKDEISALSAVFINNKFETEGRFEDIKKQMSEQIFRNINRFEMIEKNTAQNEKNLNTFTQNLIQNEALSKDAVRISSDCSKALKKVEKKIGGFTEKIIKEIENMRKAGIVNATDIARLKAETKRIDEFVKLDERGTELRLTMTEPLYLLFKDLPTLKILAEYDKERIGLINTSVFPGSIKEKVANIKVKSQGIIDAPLPVKRHDSNSSTVKNKRKERMKNVKKQLAASIATNALKVQKEESKKIKKKPTLIQSLQDTMRASMTELNPFLIVDAPSEPVQTLLTQNFPTRLSSSNLVPETKIEKPVPKNEVKSSEPKDLPTAVNETINQLVSDSSGDDSDLDNFVDFTPMINMVKVQLENQIDSIHQELKSLISLNDYNVNANIVQTKQNLMDTILSIKSTHENYNDYVNKKISEIGVCVQQAVYECNSATAIRKRDHSDYSSQFKQFNSSFDEITKQEALLNDSLEVINKKLNSLIDFCKISIALQTQDEQDRESIFLMGSKDSKRGKVVSIDKRCLSCAGQSASVIAAFKIACLAYEPSVVLFQDRRFTRKELILVQKNILKGFIKPIIIDETEEKETKAVMTSRHWRPLSVPISNFSTLTSPHLRTPDTDILPVIRKSMNN